MTLATAWLITQHDRPVVIITGSQAEAQQEFTYLSHHGSGYMITEIPAEQRAGAYSSRADSKWTNMHQVYGPWIHLDWYDGPLRSISKVKFPDGHALLEVESLGWLDEHDPDKVHVRFDREGFQKMLDHLDGKPIKNYRDDEV